MATATASTAASNSGFHQQQLNFCRHSCSHQQQQQQKQRQQQHHVKWQPDLPDRALKPKLPCHSHNGHNSNHESCGIPDSAGGLGPPNTRRSFMKDTHKPRIGFGLDSSNAQNGLPPHTRSPMVAKVSALPRKWCDFVFRRNNDNNLYKSESFRFIQKTSSLEPLLPKNAYIRNRLRKVSRHPRPQCKCVDNCKGRIMITVDS